MTLLLGLAGCGNGPEEATEMAPGQEPYLRYCASCHGNAGEGKPPTFPPLSGSEWLELPDEAQVLIILYGLRGEIEVDGRTYSGFMPPMRHIDDRDIAAIVGFMKSNWTDHESELDAEGVARLRDELSGHPPLEGLSGVEEAVEKVQ